MTLMSFDPAYSLLFEAWQDPVSGCTSYLLEKAAPYQQAFYFTNRNDAAGRYIWFYAAYPPSPLMLGVVDLVENTIRVFPETAFIAESPYIDPVNGEAYWALGTSIYRRAPDAASPVQLIGTIPPIFNSAPVRQLVTHLTRSADCRMLNIDMPVGDKWWVGTVDIESGETELWQSFDRCYKHGQFSPSDPELLMIAQDWWRDVLTGKHTHYENRIWLIRRGQEAYPLYTEGNLSRHCHEWWGADGQGIWYVDYDTGTWYHDLSTEKSKLIWSGGTCHSHASANGAYVVGDIGTYEWKTKPARVAFYNTLTGKETDIVHAMPEPPLDAMRPEPYYYHPHPHPQFIGDDRWIAYTTTVRGGLDLALTRVSDLIVATS